MRDFREKEVKGIIGDIYKIKFTDTLVHVRMTNDSRGKTLSLGVANVLISIPLESVEDIIRVVEKETK